MLRAHGGVIERRKGGFWTYPGCQVRHSVTDGGGSYDVPAWYVGTQTVEAMTKRSWLERCHKHGEAYRDDYRLTQAGLEIAGVEVAEKP